MDNQKHIKCYMVQTRFKVGIFLSEKAIQSKLSNCKYWVTKYGEYTEALENLRKLEKDADFTIDWDNFCPNKMYKLFDNRIYNVIYTYYQIGFVEDEKIHEFIKKYEIKKCKCKGHLTYIEAIQWMTTLGAITGNDEVMLRKIPVPNIWYRRM